MYRHFKGAAPLLDSKVLIYDSGKYQGECITLHYRATDLNRFQLDINKISIKVIGNESWSFYSEKNFSGDFFVLEPGEYLSLAEIISLDEKFTTLNSAARYQIVPDDDISEILPASNKYERQWPAVAAWFLGPKAENLETFNRLAVKSFTSNAEFRKTYFPTDPDYVSCQMKKEPAYRNELGQIEDELDVICKDLHRSIPITSIRMQGHMNWDTAMPGNLGYLAALLYNANNVASEASPVTTPMEIEVGNQLCGMLGFDTTKEPKPWGHIACGGTIANIEAMWSSRNVKYYPLTVQKAITEKEELTFARCYQVFVPRLNCKVNITDATKWDLLNMNIDDVIKIPNDIHVLMEKNGIDPIRYSELVEKNTLANLGWFEFMKIFGLSKQGVVCLPASHHYSWPKAATLLGLGYDSLKNVPCDENARMKIRELKKLLNECLEKKIPVITVVAVMGSTEASAVDGLHEIIFEVREEFRKKGLNFAISTDAAWGGYFTSMLHGAVTTNRPGYHGYVPMLPLSKYTRRQLGAIRFADTVTIDPHKSGFIPYPAGALCYRNGEMKSFIQLTAAYINHSDSDPLVGVYGVEGSKPGAAAVGVLLAHRVIGLDRYGYGAILGQCTFGAKLLYCLWLTLAKEDDNFVCSPLQPLPKDWELEDAKRFIKEHIEGKPNSELVQNEQVMRFMEEIGPDLVINSFALNPKINGEINKDIKICNKVINEIFLRLSSTNRRENIRRIPLIITASELDVATFGDAVQKFKQRIGLPGDTDDALSFISNCVMNPWVTSHGQIDIVSSAFRQTVLDSIGVVTDEKQRHSFVTAGLVSDHEEDNTVFGEFVAAFHVPYRQYQSIAKFKFENKSDADFFRRQQEYERRKQPESRQPVVIQSHVMDTLGSFLENAIEETTTVNCYVGLPGATNEPFLREVVVKVTDIPRFKHLDMTLTQYPDEMTYFLYGDEHGVHLSHTFTKFPDFIQVVDLLEKPKNVDDIFIKQGIDVTIPNIPGDPTVQKKIRDPLTKPNYHIEFTSFDGEKVITKMAIDQKYGKVWFYSCDIGCDN